MSLESQVAVLVYSSLYSECLLQHLSLPHFVFHRKLRKQLNVPTQKQVARKPWRTINIPGMFSSLSKPSTSAQQGPSPQVQQIPATVPPVAKPPQPEPIVID